MRLKCGFAVANLRLRKVELSVICAAIVNELDEV
jgi:hypothetical protein